MTSGTPCPLASGAKLVTRKVTAIAPTTGTRMTNGPHGLGGVNKLASYANANFCRNSTLCTRAISARKTNAPNPPTTPTMKPKSDIGSRPRRGTPTPQPSEMDDGVPGRDGELSPAPRLRRGGRAATSDSWGKCGRPFRDGEV